MMTKAGPGRVPADMPRLRGRLLGLRDSVRAGVGALRRVVPRLQGVLRRLRRAVREAPARTVPALRRGMSQVRRGVR